MAETSNHSTVWAPKILFARAETCQSTPWGLQDRSSFRPRPMLYSMLRSESSTS